MQYNEHAWTVSQNGKLQKRPTGRGSGCAFECLCIYLHVEDGKDADLVSQHAFCPVLIHSSDYSQYLVLDGEHKHAHAVVSESIWVNISFFCLFGFYQKSQTKKLTLFTEIAACWTKKTKTKPHNNFNLLTWRGSNHHPDCPNNLINSF